MRLRPVVQARVTRWALRALVAALCLGGGPGAAAGQGSVASIVADRQLEYEAAEADYLAALQAVRVLERQWDQAVGDAERARRSNDVEAREQALARAQELTLPLQSGEQRVRDTREAWMASARALASALDARLDLLADQIQRSDTADAEREALATLWRDTRNRLVSMEDVLSEAQAFELRPLPEITTDARDGPEDILIKAELLDRRAQEYDVLVREVNQEIESLQRRVRRNRVIDDFLSGLERFDDTRMPVTPETQRTAVEDAEAQPDSINASDPSAWSLEYRIQQLTILRDEVESRRDRVEEKAQLFRRLATSGNRS